MAYPAKAIANYFIMKSQTDPKDGDLTPLKLLKLVYVAHGWYLALKDEPLIEERIMAWRFGPVIDSIYHEFKRFGNKEITELARDEDDIVYCIPPGNAYDNQFLDKVWKEYGHYSATQLTNWSHEAGSPWHVAWHEENGKDRYNYAINDNEIKKYFSQLKAAA